MDIPAIFIASTARPSIRRVSLVQSSLRRNHDNKQLDELVFVGHAIPTRDAWIVDIRRRNWTPFLWQ
jgi:hypothetical protein